MAPKDINRKAVPTYKDVRYTVKNKTASQTCKKTSNDETNTIRGQSIHRIIDQANKTTAHNKRQIDKLSKRKRELEATHSQLPNIRRCSSHSNDRTRDKNSSNNVSQTLVINTNISRFDTSFICSEATSGTGNSSCFQPYSHENYRLPHQRHPPPAPRRLEVLLPQCLAEVTARAPDDPVDFMSSWLRQALANEQTRRHSLDQIKEEVNTLQAIEDDERRKRDETEFIEKALANQGIFPRNPTSDQMERERLFRNFTTRTRDVQRLQLGGNEKRSGLPNHGNKIPKSKLKPLPDIGSNITLADAVEENYEEKSDVISSNEEIENQDDERRSQTTDTNGRSESRIIDSQKNLEDDQIDETGTLEDGDRLLMATQERVISSHDLLLAIKSSLELCDMFVDGMQSGVGSQVEVSNHFNVGVKFAPDEIQEKGKDLKCDFSDRMAAKYKRLENIGRNSDRSLVRGAESVTFSAIEDEVGNICSFTCLMSENGYEDEDENLDEKLRIIETVNEKFGILEEKLKGLIAKLMKEEGLAIKSISDILEPTDKENDLFIKKFSMETKTFRKENVSVETITTQKANDEKDTTFDKGKKSLKGKEKLNKTSLNEKSSSSSFEIKEQGSKIESNGGPSVLRSTVYGLIMSLRNAKKKFMKWSCYFQEKDIRRKTIAKGKNRSKFGDLAHIKDFIASLQEDKKNISDNRSRLLRLRSQDAIDESFTGPVVEEGFRIAFCHPVLGKLGGCRDREEQFSPSKAAAKNAHSYTQGLYTGTYTD